MFYSLKETIVTRGWLTRVVETLQEQPHARLLAIAPDNKIPGAKGYLLHELTRLSEKRPLKDTSL